MLVPDWWRAQILLSKVKRFGANVNTEPLHSAYHFTFEKGAKLKRVNCVGKGFSIKIGADSYWRSGMAIGNIHIGRFCSISSNVTIGLEKNGHPTNWLSSSPAQYSKSHLCKHRTSPTLSYQPKLSATIIQSDVWIGNRATVMNGVQVGVGAIIAAGSIVTKSVPPYAIVAGIPAELVKYRFNHEVIQRLLDSHWWNLHPEYLADLPFSDIGQCLSLLESNEQQSKKSSIFDGSNYAVFEASGLKHLLNESK